MSNDTTVKSIDDNNNGVQITWIDTQKNKRETILAVE